MPAPQAMIAKNLARTKFASFGLKVPHNWQDPQGEASDHYGQAFQANEKSSSPAMGTPVLFQPASLNKYHTDVQKMMHAKFGGFIDDIIDAICSAWGVWQKTATMTGLVIAGPTVSAGVIVGPPLTPLILKDAPKGTPGVLKFSQVIANVIGTAWQTFTATIKFPALPLFPAYAAVPTPVAPPMPHPPIPLATLPQLPVSILTQTLKAQMVLQHADPTAQYHQELYECIAHAFEMSYNTWKTTSMITNLLAVATGGTPVTPIPAVGTATMPPGGLT